MRAVKTNSNHRKRRFKATLTTLEPEWSPFDHRERKKETFPAQLIAACVILHVRTVEIAIEAMNYQQAVVEREHIDVIPFIQAIRMAEAPGRIFVPVGNKILTLEDGRQRR
ncbi:hypothetical protein TNCV_2859561 [Trichonephila clavipes]|nr:hypothetical protein TNCV_2859561 [Trichonephila clavipes]